MPILKRATACVFALALGFSTSVHAEDEPLATPVFDQAADCVIGILNNGGGSGDVYLQRRDEFLGQADFAEFESRVTAAVDLCARKYGGVNNAWRTLLAEYAHLRLAIPGSVRVLQARKITAQDAAAAKDLVRVLDEITAWKEENPGEVNIAHETLLPEWEQRHRVSSGSLTELQYWEYVARVVRARALKREYARLR